MRILPAFCLLLTLSAGPSFAQSAFTIQRRDAPPPAPASDEDERAAEATLHATDKAVAHRRAVVARRARARLDEERLRADAERREEEARHQEADRWKTLPYWARDRQGRYHEDDVINRRRDEHAVNAPAGCVSLDGLPLG